MFPCTNNAAEYEALLYGLRMAKEMNLSRVKCFGDSDLVAQQVSGTWDSKDPLMAAYRREVDMVAGYFKGYQVEHIDRRKNESADTLSRLGSQRKPVPPNTFLDILLNPSIKLPTKDDLVVPDLEAQLVAALHAIPDWTVTYLAYMRILARQITDGLSQCQLSMGSCIIAVSQGHFTVASLLKKAVRFYGRFTKEIMVIIPALNLS